MSHWVTRRAASRVLAGAAASCAALAQKPDPRPNIVFVLLDDLRWNALGCMGHPFAKTPHIDRVAREGALFRNAFVTTPLCSPSRASFLTGRWVHAHGVRGNGNNNELSHRLVTWPRLLHDAGYETGYFGKWHMGNDDSPRPGFDRWVSFRGQGQYGNPALNIDGQPVKAEGYMTDLLNGHALEFVERRRNRPFALYLAHKAVHGPFTPAQRHENLYASEPIERLPSVRDTLEGKPALRRGADPQRPQAQPNDDLVRNQLRCLAAVDDGVGKLIDALASSGRLDNTFFVFTSDNGYLWGEHGLGDKRAFYEESIRIPLLVRYPKLIRAGARLDQPALSVDVAPTMLELAGAPIPREVKGQSLLGLLGGKSRNWRGSFLAEYFEEPNFPRIPGWNGIRGERWKYTHYTALEGMDELYDLKNDPYEMRNLIRDPAAQPVLKQMQAELERQLKETA